MATVKQFNIVSGGVALLVTATDLGGGQVKFDILMEDGSASADINAIYWGDSYAEPGKNAQYNLGGSLNMNGSGVDFDGGLALSQAGLGHAAILPAGSTDTGLLKDTYLTAGETYSVTATLDFNLLENFGVRATSVGGEGGSSIKGTDDSVATLTQRAVFDFEQDNVDTTGFNPPGDNPDAGPLFTQVVPQFWTSANGVVEIQGGASGYGGHSLYGAGEDQYLDTAKSAGNIDITSNAITNMTDGAKVQIDISVAPQDLIYPGNGQHYVTHPDATFELFFNDQLVKTFSMDDFGNQTAGNLDFENFSFDKAADNSDLIAALGDDHISIVAHGQQNEFTGFSVDHIVVSEWVV